MCTTAGAAISDGLVIRRGRHWLGSGRRRRSWRRRLHGGSCWVNVRHRRGHAIFTWHALCCGRIIEPRLGLVAVSEPLLLARADLHWRVIALVGLNGVVVRHVQMRRRHLQGIAILQEAFPCASAAVDHHDEALDVLGRHILCLPAGLADLHLLVQGLPFLLETGEALIVPGASADYFPAVVTEPLLEITLMAYAFLDHTLVLIRGALAVSLGLHDSSTVGPHPRRNVCQTRVKKLGL
mmetsp:Transcript_27998/g.70614  ORF Transcript_27998/g.70614 Transcript_27998/m.70614 type:complete len:238 (-) Transcript_27998:765-1478(-)